MTLLGADVSHWQVETPGAVQVPATFDMSNLSFLIARASIGTQKDEFYDAFIRRARGLGLVVGAYHFGYDNVSISAQVAAFLRAAGDVDLYFIDVEGTHALSHDQTHTFLHLMHQAGKRCGLYHSASGFWDAGQDYDWIADYRTWVNHKTPGTFWQYTSSGHLPGYTGRLDMDKFNGTKADLMRLVGLTGPDSGVKPPVSEGDPSMRLTSIRDIGGTATLNADGPVWNVATGDQVNASKGTSWRVVGTCQYDSPGEPGGTTSPGYMIAANAADMELHVVAQSRVTFKATAVPAVDCTAQVNSAVAVQVAADKKALDAANAALVTTNAELSAAKAEAAAAKAGLASASTAERERIALAEADRVRSL